VTYSFSKRLLNWYKINPRQHPWKKTKDPYTIWISEIILQQTKVEAGTPYFLRFIEKFPTVEVLAEAALDDVYAVWKGLGYYSRARNLHESAQRIVSEFDGVFPDSYEEILSLKGIGPYTAAAIASFAFDLPTPVLDGNVKRVIARHYGFEEDVMTQKASKTLLTIIEDDYFSPKVAALFNQAIMDFGATVCKPKRPHCEECPMTKDCFALKNQKTGILPVRKNKIKRKERVFHYLVFRHDQQVFFNKRENKDIWQNLFDFPLLEGEKRQKLSREELQHVIASYTVEPIDSKEIVIKGPKQQDLSHQRIIAWFYSISLQDIQSFNTKGLYLFDLKKSSSFAVPKIVDWYLKDKSIYLFS